MTIRRAIARAWTDDAYKSWLRRDPHAALADVGVAVPPETNIKVVEDTVETQHLVLPVRPEDSHGMSVEELEAVVGGTDGKIIGIDLGQGNGA